MLANLACSVIWLEDGTSSTSEMAWMVSFGFFSGPALLARNTFGQGHVFFCPVYVKAEQLFFVGANIVLRTALDNAAERAKIKALCGTPLSVSRVCNVHGTCLLAVLEFLSEFVVFPSSS